MGNMIHATSGHSFFTSSVTIRADEEGSRTETLYGWH